MGDRHLFIGNLCNITIESLREYCEKYGTITNLSLSRDKEKNIYHCFAFVTFQSSRNATQFMSKRPHIINGELVFVKRALSRITASIPERLVVTNRLVLSDSTKYDKQSLRNYFENLGSIKNFDYKKGFIDFDDYDDVDRILVARPHYIQNKPIDVTKFIPNEQQKFEEESDSLVNSFIGEDEDLKMKYKYLKKEFEDYKQLKEKELDILRKELETTKEELSDITQIKLDRLIKNQQLFQDQLLFRLHPNTDILHAQDFLQSTPNKKRKTTTATAASSSSSDNEYEY